MKLFSAFSSVTPRAESFNYTSNFFKGGYIPDEWVSAITASGIHVTPDLAMTLSAWYCGVTTIAYDLATLPFIVYKRREDDGKDRVRGGQQSFGNGGISSLVYILRYQPNNYMTATEYFSSLIAQLLLRGRAYSEITPGPTGFLEQLLPRHPDRVTPERLPNGRLRYKLIEANGQPRYVLQDEMHVVRDLTHDGMTVVSRVQYAATATGTALAAERASAKFFKSGMTSALLATYEGEMEEEDEAALHKSITRFAAGVDNSFGLMLVPDNITVTNLGINPEKAQMMLAKEWGVREVARYLRIPGYKLGIKDSVAYASQVQSAIDYVITCLRPIAVLIEQAIQRDLILVKDTYFVECLLEALLRGDPDARASYYERAIRNRWMRPSEVRLRENMNPDPALDRLSEQDFRPGQSAPGGGASGGNRNQPQALSRVDMKAYLAMYDSAMYCVRRERTAVEKIAKKHADDPDGWKAELREFYGEHAQTLMQRMRLHPVVARGYAAQHGSEFEARGTVLIDGQAGAEWERWEADELTCLALCDAESPDQWFSRRPEPVVE